MIRSSGLYERIKKLSPRKQALLAQKLAGHATAPFNAARITARRPGTGPFPLSYAQQRLWFLEQLEPGSCRFNIPAAVRLIGPVDHVALERAISAIVDRHEILRTTFHTLDGRPVQVVHPPQPTRMKIVSLMHVDEPARLAEAIRLATAAAHAPFDLETGPLLRSTVFEVGPCECVLLVVMHHIISDGWSIKVFVRELFHFYRGFRSGSAPELPELPVQYIDYALWQREWLAEGALESQLAYWRQMLAQPVPVLELAADHQPTVRTGRAGEHARLIDERTTTGLRRFARRHKITLFLVLLAAFSIALAEQAGRHCFRIGTDVASRNRREIEGLIGFFVNQLVLCIDVSPRSSLDHLLERLRSVVVGACDHQDVPFDRLVEALRPPRRDGHAPYFAVKLIHEEAPPVLPLLDGLALEEVPLPRPLAELDLLASFTLVGGELAGHFEFAADVLHPETIVGIAEAMQAVLTQIATDGPTDLGTLYELAAQRRRAAAVRKAHQHEDGLLRAQPLRKRADPRRRMP
jgi:hypothetical protein